MWHSSKGEMPRRLIINADDLGYDPEVTRGIITSMRQGVVSSTTFMVNTPHSETAAKQADGLAVGLHLNLARYAPLSANFPAALLSQGELSEPRAAELPEDVVRDEVLAQLDRLANLLGHPATHVDVHKHLHRHPRVLAGLAAAAKMKGLPVRSIDPAMRATLRSLGVATTDHFIGEAGTDAYWTPEQLVLHLTQFQEGVTELMCHPGYAPSTLKSGYAEQREVELKTFTTLTTRALLEHAGVELVTFSAVGPPPVR
jgi:predicted glycoside hydrolase/deacetylase ChbG (UPF0249 family)